MNKPKCEDIGFKHAWQEVENNLVYATMPPTAPPPKRVCINCGLKQELVVLQPLKKEWQVIK